MGDVAVTPGTRSAFAMTAGHWSMERRRCEVDWTVRAMAVVVVAITSGRGASRGRRRVMCGCEPRVLSINEVCKPPISADRKTITETPTATAARASPVWALSVSR